MHTPLLRYLPIALILLAQSAVASTPAGRDRTAVAGRNSISTSRPVVRISAPLKQLLDERSLLPGNTTGAGREDGKNLLADSKSSLRIIPNRGQVADTEGKVRPDVLYTVDAPGAMLYFRREGVSYVFSKHEPGNQGMEDREAFMQGAVPNHEIHETTLYRMDELCEGGHPFPRIGAAEPLDGVSHYYYAHCPDGVTHVPAYGRITYEDIYRNIDLVYFSSGGRMKYEFIVHPGGEVSDIRLRFRGAGDMYLDERGDLHAVTPLGELTEQAPVSYQEGGRSVASDFLLMDETIRFNVGAYDRAADLIIDPWATYVGGNDSDYPSSITIDNNGNSVFTGYTSSQNFPVQSAMQATFGGGDDAFVMKFSSSCSLSWSTFWGGSATDRGRYVACDLSGNYYITGVTGSTNLPMQNALQPTIAGGYDAYILKLNSAGIRQMATYFGGSGDESGSYDYGIAVNANGSVYFAMLTESTNIPVSNAHQTANAGGADYFLACFTQSPTSMLSVSWATYFGGTGFEYGASLSLDQYGNCIIAGYTASTNFPLLNAVQNAYGGGGNDAILAKFSGSGTLLWSTYFGGSNYDGFNGVITDGSGNIWTAGSTYSANFPTLNPIQSTFGGGTSDDAMIVKFSAAGTLLMSTFYGAGSAERAMDVALGANGQILVGGQAGAGFPLLNPVQSAYGGGSRDAFVLVLSSSGTQLSATYYGGSDQDYCRGIAGDNTGNVYFVGGTSSTNFPLLNAWQTQYGGGNQDGFFVLLGASSTFSTSPLSSTQYCSGDHVTVNFTSNATFNSSNVFTAQLSGPTGSFTTPVAIGTEPGNTPGPIYCTIPSNTPSGNGYRIRVVSSSPSMTASDNGQNLTIMPTPVAAIIPPTPQQICPNGSVVLTSSPASFYQWFRDGTPISGATAQAYTVTQEGQYRVRVYNSPACPDTSAAVMVSYAPSDTTHLRWTASLSRDWSTPGNWNHPCAVPDDGDTVVIAGTAEPPLSIPRLRLSMLELDRQGVIALADYLNITDELVLNNGILALAGHHLRVAATGEIRGGGASSFVAVRDSGTLSVGGIGPAKGAVRFPVGPVTTIYSPLTLYNSGVADDFRVGVREGLHRGGLWGPGITSNAVHMTWVVEESQPGGSDAELTLQWNGANELAGFNRQRCMIARHGASGWLYLQPPAAASGSNPYTRTVTGLTAFSPFSVGDSAANLPLRLASFSASAAGSTVILRWETSAESNCHGFQLQWKLNHPGSQWSTFGFVPCRNAQGHGYSFTDPHAGDARSDELCYRLLMLDSDGSASSSPELTVRMDRAPLAFALGEPYPQPAAGAVTIPFTLDEPSGITLAIFTATGSRAHTVFEGHRFERGTHAVTAALAGLPAGVYLMELRSPAAARTAVLLLSR